MIAFAFGPYADQVGRLGAAERRQVFLDALVERFGEQAAAPKYYEEIQWADEIYSGGGIFAHLPPGVWTRYGHLLHQPLDRVHFAGTETSSAGHGSINGAVESGERAASEVLAAL